MHRGTIEKLDFRIRRVMAVALVACAVVVVAGAAAPAGQASAKLSPGKFADVSTGIALIKTYGCGGRPIALGTGFLVGDSVVMTARHVVHGACRVRVSVNGETFNAQRWVAWYSGHASVAAADIETIKLDHAAVGDHVFRIRSTSPPFGTNISAVGYPLGNRLSLNQGKLVRRWRVSGAPVIVVHMIGAHGGSGSPFLDDAGRVVGILQVGLSSNASDESASYLYGLDLVRWWGPRARLDLCRAYPKGGIAGCPSTEPPPPQPPPPPSPPPSDYAVDSCWVQNTAGSWANVSAADGVSTIAQSELLANGPANYWSVVALALPAPSVIHGLTASLIDPAGNVSPGTPFDLTPGEQDGESSLAWTHSDGSYFFQDPAFGFPQPWTIRWTFPDGETCDAPFTVT